METISTVFWPLSGYKQNRKIFRKEWSWARLFSIKFDIKVCFQKLGAFHENSIVSFAPRSSMLFMKIRPWALLPELETFHEISRHRSVLKSSVFMEIQRHSIFGMKIRYCIYFQKLDAFYENSRLSFAFSSSMFHENWTLSFALKSSMSFISIRYWVLLLRLDAFHENWRLSFAPRSSMFFMKIRDS